MLIKENLFATPIWQQTLSQDFNNELLEECNSYKDPENIFSAETDNIKKLKKVISDAHMMIYYEYGPKGREDLTQTVSINGRLNTIKYGENDTPHSHIGKSLLVGVYYLDVEDNSGDLLLHDPRGAVSWEKLNFTPDDPKGWTGRTYHRIKPKNGLLIMFPGFLIHSVETNLNSKLRKSIVIHI